MKTKIVEATNGPSLENIAWFAGLWEGEGSCIVEPRRKHRKQGFRVRLTLSSTDRDVILRVGQITKVSTISTYARRPFKTIYTWEAGKRADTARLINLLLPFAGDRRKSKLKEAQAALATIMFCKKGKHLMVPENVGRYLGGSKKCLGCADARRSRAAVSQRLRRAICRQNS